VPLPGDASSAAFLVVAALLVPGSEIRILDVGVNPTRIGAFDILRRMGADVSFGGPRVVAGEPHADLVVRASRLRGTTITASEVPAAIDELPVLAVAAALADGTTTLTGAAELRVKESDRLAALEQVAAVGGRIRTTPDGFVVEGSAGRTLRGGAITTGGDHRTAMAFAVAGLVSSDGVAIDDPACVDVSFPGFFAALRTLGATVQEDACGR